jgi:hypothetical protein
MSASARCFPIGGRLQHIWKIGRRRFGVTRSNRVRERWAHAFALGRYPSSRARVLPHPDRSASPAWLPSHAGPELHVERAIHMADTSQSARVARVGLACQIDSDCHRLPQTLRAPAVARRATLGVVKGPRPKEPHGRIWLFRPRSFRHASGLRPPGAPLTAVSSVTRDRICDQVPYLSESENLRFLLAPAPSA